MAISLAGKKMRGEKAIAARQIQEEFARQRKKEGRRGLLSGVLGGGLGKLLGGAAVGALGLTGFGAPIAMALGSMAGKQLAYGATKGMGADLSKLKAGKYGLGAESVKAGQKALREQERALDPSKTAGGFGAELVGAYTSALGTGKLKGALGKLTSGEAGAFVDPDAVKGWAGVKGELGSLFPGFKGEATDIGSPLAQEELLESTLIPEGGGSLDTLISQDQLDALNIAESPVSEELLQSPVFTQPVEDDQSWIPGFQQGGQVPNQQQQLMQMIALQKLLNPTAYDNTVLEEVGLPEEIVGQQVANGTQLGRDKQQQTISEYFGAQGKTLGGSNTKSLSQMLGKR